jgi:hypothetical protein
MLPVYWINSNIAERLTKGTMVELFARIGVNACSGMNGEAKAILTFDLGISRFHKIVSQARLIKIVNEIIYIDNKDFNFSE